MFFSANTLYEAASNNLHIRRSIESVTDRPLSKRSVKQYVKAAKNGIIKRELDCSFDVNYKDYPDTNYFYVGKWHRPWEVVPKLKNFQAPEGDYGIGVEVEMGFRSYADVTFVTNAIKNWRHIAIDEEGGNWPLEVTFPPMVYSKINKRTAQPFRYLQLLKDNINKVETHLPEHLVGTHINVSKANCRIDPNRVRYMHSTLTGLFGFDGEEETSEYPNLAYKYFNRIPYEGCFLQNSKYVEFKLFNSTPDPDVLVRYINIAKCLFDLILSTENINEHTVLAACELGFNKTNFSL